MLFDPQQQTTLAIALIIAINCRSQLGTHQLLKQITAMEPKVAAKFITRIYALLGSDARGWLEQEYQKF